MTRMIVTGTTPFCMFFLTGCATIMSRGPQTLPILTQPDGAECEITDDAAGKSIVKTKTPHTSALELGLDIPYLTLAILVGVPYSATSFYQRIGRIGRHAPGEVIIVNGGGPGRDHGLHGRDARDHHHRRNARSRRKRRSCGQGHPSGIEGAEPPKQQRGILCGKTCSTAPITGGRPTGGTVAKR